MHKYYVRISKPVDAHTRRVKQEWVYAHTLQAAIEACKEKMTMHDTAFIYDAYMHEQICYIGKGYKSVRMNSGASCK